jgi:hypothetical protein
MSHESPPSPQSIPAQPPFSMSADLALKVATITIPLCSYLVLQTYYWGKADALRCPRALITISGPAVLFFAPYLVILSAILLLAAALAMLPLIHLPRLQRRALFDPLTAVPVGILGLCAGRYIERWYPGLHLMALSAAFAICCYWWGLMIWSHIASPSLDKLAVALEERRWLRFAIDGRRGRGVWMTFVGLVVFVGGALEGGYAAGWRNATDEDHRSITLDEGSFFIVYEAQDYVVGAPIRENRAERRFRALRPSALPGGSRRDVLEGSVEWVDRLRKDDDR